MLLLLLFDKLRNYFLHHSFRWRVLKGIPQYFGPLEINTDIGILAGHSLLVTERDNVLKKSGHYVLKKAASVGYRSTRLFTSASTEESLETNDTTKTTTKQPKPRWSLQLFGVKVCITKACYMTTLLCLTFVRLFVHS